MALKPLNHTGSVPLQTERLMLRPTRLSDAEQMFANWASDPQVTQYLSWEAHADVEVTKSVLALWNRENERADRYHWGIVLKETGQIIGTVGVLTLQEQWQSAEIGYCIGRDHWGKGYMSEAVAALFAHLFTTVGLNRITARHDLDNIASGRVMQKCGMAFEGVERKARYCARRGFYDAACYAILKSDFEDQGGIA